MELVHDVDKAGSAETRDNLLLFGGAALVVLGAGMILSSSAMRKYVGGLNPASLLQAAIPDWQRYLKLKEM